MVDVIVKVNDQAISVAPPTDDQVVVPVQFEKDQVVRIEVISV
jgi:hypothetical protein